MYTANAPAQKQRLMFIEDDDRLWGIYADHILYLKKRYDVAAESFSLHAWNRLMDTKYDAIILGDNFDSLPLTIGEVDFSDDHLIGGIEIALLLSEVPNPNRDTPLLHIGNTSPTVMADYVSGKGFSRIPFRALCKQADPKGLDLTLKMTLLFAKGIPKA